MIAVLSASPSASPASGPVPTVPIWRLSVQQYHQMIEAGILGEDDPVELLEGWLVVKRARKPPHRAATRLAREVLEPFVPPGWYVDSQEPITTRDSEPEPDVMVVRGSSRDFTERHPGPTDVTLVVEVADTSLQRDRTIKKRLYAAAGIEVYWILNLIDGQLEVYSHPEETAGEPDYQRRRDYALEDSAPLLLGESEVARVAIRELLP